MLGGREWLEHGKPEGGLMGGTADESKGRAKKAAGELTGDDRLKREGDVDKASGQVKKVTDKVADKAKDAFRK